MKKRFLPELVLLLVFSVILAVMMITRSVSRRNSSSEDYEGTVPTFTYSDPDKIGMKISDLGQDIYDAVDYTTRGRAAYRPGVVEKDIQSYEGRGYSGWPADAEVSSTISIRKYGEDQVYALTDPAYKESYERIVLFVHGGGYIMDMPKSTARLCDEIAMTTRARVDIPLYRPIYNGTCTDAYEFLLEVYQDLLSEGKELVIMGDSAGGGLALGFTLYLRELGMKTPDKMVLICPWLDVTLSNPDIKNYEDRDRLLGVYGLTLLGKMWADDLDVKDYRVSPIYGSFGNEKEMPDTLLICGTEEIMYPDTNLLYEKLKAEGYHVQMIVGEGLFHVYPMTQIPEALTTRAVIEEFITK